MPDVIGGLIWKFIFDTLPGFVNGVLIRGGVLAEPIDFFGTPLLAFVRSSLPRSGGVILSSC
jgi:ABC-type sugar transport system permease subunit